MSPDAPRTPRARLSAAVRMVHVPAILFVSYVILGAMFELVSGRQGLLTPDGSPALGVVLLGLVVLGLRLVVLFFLPGVVTYQLVVRLVGGERAARGDVNPETGVLDPTGTGGGTPGAEGGGGKSP